MVAKTEYIFTNSITEGTTFVCNRTSGATKIAGINDATAKSVGYEIIQLSYP